jgi:YD repeat-containing protein
MSSTNMNDANARASSRPARQVIRRQRVTPEQEAIRLASLQEPANRLVPNLLGSQLPVGVPSIVEMARALKNDVDLIYQFVANNVDFVPTYELHKGGLGALIDGSGNAFDQSDLMVQLLTQAGYTASYVVGSIVLSQAQWSNWLNTTGIDNAEILLVNGGIPVSVNQLTSQLTITHCWVQVNIGGTNYVFDPTFKTYNTVAGIDLASVMGYTQTGFLTDAQSGATIAADNSSAQNINETNIDADLTTYSMNLVNWIKTNNPGATLEDILGGQTIVPISGTVRQTSLPYQASSPAPTTYAYPSPGLPSSLKATLDVSAVQGQLAKIFNTADIHGQRLTLWFDTTGLLHMYLNGVQVAVSSTPLSSGSTTAVVFDYTGQGINASTTFAKPLGTNQGLAIGTMFGSSSRKLAENRRVSLSQAIATNGSSSTSENVAGEASAVIAYHVLGQLSQACDIVDAIADTKTVFQYAIDGLFFTNAGNNQYYAINSTLWGTTASRLSGPVPDAVLSDNAVTLTDSMILHTAELAVGQLTGVGSGTAVTVIQLANQSGGTIYNAFSNGQEDSWTTIVQPALTTNGWAAADINSIDAIVSSGGLAVTATPNIPIGMWKVSPWVYLTGSMVPEFFFSDFDNTKGSFADESQTADEFNVEVDSNGADIGGDGYPIPASVVSNEPIDLFKGRYLYTSTDISVGNQDEPYALSFSRSYNSGNRNVNQGLGLGWNHNFQINATVNSDGFLTLGDQSAAMAAPAIAVLYVANDILTSYTANFDTAPTIAIDQLVALIIAFQWLGNQMTDNAALIQFGGQYQKWCKMPDGSFLPPLGVKGSTTLVNTGGVFTYTTPDKVVYTFNSSGQISTIAYPFGVTITFTYTSGNLTSVSNGFRTLTLAYSGNTLTSVSDGNGRSVSYTLDSNSDQTVFTDALLNKTTYLYDQPGRMTKIFRPANPSSPVVTNVYDSLSRVQTQSDAYNNTWTYFFAGSRSEEVDPNGNSHAMYFDYQGNVVKDIDQLGNITTTVYDGLERPTLVTLPEDNSTSFAYDALSNVLTVTATPKPTSALSPITNVFTYDPMWNKVKTSKDGNGNVTTFTFDPTSSRLTNVTYPAVAAGTAQVNMTYNGIGQLLTLTDPTNVKTAFTYDGTTKNLLTQVVDATTGGLNLTTTLTYDSVGNLATVQDPNGNTTTLQFDANRRLTQKTDPAPFGFITKYFYDANSNLTQVQRPDGSQYTSTYFIDDLIATIAEPPINGTSSPNPTSLYAYDNMRRLLTETDAQGNTYTYSYDALSRLFQVTDPTNTICETRLYQVNGQNAPSNGYLSSISDALGHATQYLYDGFDRLSTTTYADASTEQYSYDSNSNVLQITTRAGATIGFTYDALNQTSTKSPQSEATVTYSYDLAGRIAAAATPVVSGDASTGSFQQFYDTAGRFFKEQYSDGKTVALTLDSNGNVTGIAYPATAPDSFAVTRAYDQLNRLTGISAGAGSVSVGYDDLSRRTSLTYGNGIVQSYGYDASDNLLSLMRGGSAALQYNYSYNNVHQIVAKTASSSAYLWHPSTTGATTYGAVNGVNEYPTVGSATYSYNGNGCLTGDGTWTYGYDTESRLLSATNSSTSVSFEYDPLGRQLLKTVGSTKTEFIYSGLQRIADYDGSGNLLNRYVFGDALDEPLFALLLPVQSRTCTPMTPAQSSAPLIRAVIRSVRMSTHHSARAHRSTPSISATPGSASIRKLASISTRDVIFHRS